MRADLSLGVNVELVPTNSHDRDAVAAVGEGEIVGYVNKQKAALLASALADGADLVAFVVAGAPAATSPARVCRLSPQNRRLRRTCAA